MNKVSSREKMAKPWDPSNPAEAVVDVLTLGAARKRRAQRILAHYADMDEYILSHRSRHAHTATPRLLPDLVAGPKIQGIAQLALEVVRNADVIHISTFQGYEATSTRNTDGSRRASSGFVGYMHEPTLYRIGEATGRDYVQNLRSARVLAVLATQDGSSIEGIGLMANEYYKRESRTGRLSDATFLIQGLPSSTAEQFVGSLREYPARILDGVVYTAFADVDPPGRSLLQAPLADQPPDSLFVPGACTKLRVVTAP